MEEDEVLARERAIYARWLGSGVYLGFGALVVSFVVYMTRLLPPGIPPQDLPRYWGLPVAEYVKATGSPSRWRREGARRSARASRSRRTGEADRRRYPAGRS